MIKLAAFFLILVVPVFADQLDKNKDGLIGLWHLNEGNGTGTNDASNKGNNGTLVGSPSWETSKHGYRLKFENTSSAVEIANQSDYSFGIANPFTYGVVFNRKTTTVGRSEIVMCKGSSADHWEMLTESDGAVQRFKWYARCNGCSDPKNFIIWRSDLDVEKFTDGNDHVWIVTYDGNNSGTSSFHIYIDGTDGPLTNSGATNIPGAFVNSQPLRLGGGASGGVQDWTGSGDEFFVFNRAISAGEASFISNQILGRVKGSQTVE